MGGIKPEEFDAFHEQIGTEELSRVGSGGAAWGSPASRETRSSVWRVSPRARVSLCLDRACEAGLLMSLCSLCSLPSSSVTEPTAGSDVANLKTTAKKTADGKHYIVNGEKKWITNGVFADFFTTAVRTGEEGMGGVSLLVIERSKGVKTTQMKCSGVWPSGTTYVEFDDVLVPVENLIGKENQGFRYIMYNFNHERSAHTHTCSMGSRGQ